MRIATCSLVGFLFGPRVRRTAARVAQTPPPRVTVPLRQSTTAAEDGAFAAAFAAAKGCEVVFDLRAIGIATRDQMRDIITARCPNQKHDSAAQHAEASAPNWLLRPLIQVIDSSDGSLLRHNECEWQSDAPMSGAGARRRPLDWLVRTRFGERKSNIALESLLLFHKPGPRP